METIICNKPGCTLAETGKCILEYDPLTCPERLALAIDENEPVAEEITTTVSIENDPGFDRFPGSYTLSSSDVTSLMNKSYCKVIGILGAPNSGKTACLASLYLMLAHGKFGMYDFRDSKTIMAFEEISTGARKWGIAGVPDQLTNHTQITDERTAGFLHIRLQSSTTHKFDILLPDLPGEWSTTLIDNNRIDRLSFLRGAEALWIFVSAEEISVDAKRNLTMHRLEILMDRLTAFYNNDNGKPPISIVITHKDRFTVTENDRKKLDTLCNSFDFSFKVIEIASFSSNDAIEPGDGITNLIDDLLQSPTIGDTHFWLAYKNGEQYSTRQILSYGKQHSA